MPYSDGTLSRTTNGSKMTRSASGGQPGPLSVICRAISGFAPPPSSSAENVTRLPAGSVDNSSVNNNSNSRRNFGLSAFSAGSESGIRFSISIRREVTWSWSTASASSTIWRRDTSSANGAEGFSERSRGP